MNKITPGYELASKTKIFLREQAEGIVRKKVALSTDSLEAMSPAAVRVLVHELQVHQIELEMQNEELRQTQLQLEESRARYFELYDLAPISYCTVSEAGVIIEANLAMAELLDEARCYVVGQRISRYICKEYQDTYYLFSKLLDAHDERQGCELRLIRAEGEVLWVFLNITAAKDSKGARVQRMMLTDITNAKVMALAMRDSKSRLRALVDSHV